MFPPLIIIVPLSIFRKMCRRSDPRHCYRKILNILPTFIFSNQLTNEQSFCFQHAKTTLCKVHQEKMATEAAMRTYLRDVIGIADPIERRQAIQGEGLSVIGDFAEFEKDDIETLCSSVRKPGGTIANPNAAAANAPATIPNPGYSIPAICEKRLVSAAYVAKIYSMIGREITQASMGRARLKKYDEHRQLVEAHQDPEKLPQISRNFGVMKALDQITSHLRERLGVTNVALSYVIRETPTPGPVPNQANNSATSAAFASIMDELIAYAPHTGDAYKEDNAKVFQIFQDLTHNTTHESSIKPFQRGRDGRGAYFALCQHNLGSSKWDKIIETAENYVLRKEWNGKNARFNLKQHISKHRDAHNEMVRAAQFHEYEVPNEHTRVGRLLRSITTTESTVVSAKTLIQGDSEKRNSFESAADFLLLTCPDKNVSINLNTHRVSATNTNNNSSKQRKYFPPYKKGSRTGVELRYYKKHQYKKLSDEQKRELAELRAADDLDSSTTQTNQETQMNQVAALQQQISDLESRLVAALATSQATRSSDPLTNPLNQRS